MKIGSFHRAWGIALLVPLLLFGAIWTMQWRRLHPPCTVLDEQVRVLLLSADRVDVWIENVEIVVGGVRQFVTRISPRETRSVAKYVNLTTEQPDNWGTGYVPIVYLSFYKNGRLQGSLCTSYSVWGFNHFLAHPSKMKIRRGLHPTTLLRLRQLIAQHSEIMQALVKAGAEPQYLAPNSFTANRP